MAGTTAGSASTSPESVHNPACVKLIFLQGSLGSEGMMAGMMMGSASISPESVHNPAGVKLFFFAGQPRVRGHDGRHDDGLLALLQKHGHGGRVHAADARWRRCVCVCVCV